MLGTRPIKLFRQWAKQQPKQAAVGLTTAKPASEPQTFVFQLAALFRVPLKNR